MSVLPSPIVPRTARHASPSIDEVFVDGFEGCLFDRLKDDNGVEIFALSNAYADEREFTRRTPSNRFGAAVALNDQENIVRLDHRGVRSGPMRVGCATFEQPSTAGEIWTRGSWETMFFFLPTTLFADICEAIRVPLDPACLELVNPPARCEPFMLELSRRILSEMTATTAFSELRAGLIAQDLAIHLLLNHTNARGTLSRPIGDRRTRGGLAPGQLRRACDAMDGMIEQELTLARIAATAGCSPTHFSRAFKQSTGLSPFAWLLNRRIRRAKELLRKGTMPIAEIALEVGFAAQPQFTTAFRRVTGTTPGAWRRRNEG